MHPITAIGFETDVLAERACALAVELNLTVDNHHFPRLSVTTDKLVLLVENFTPLFVDFSQAVWQKRRDAGKKQGLVRACKPAKGLRILDATAGWGRDAVVLASFGAEVTMVERQPVMAALLADGLSRVPAESLLAMTIVNLDAKAYLQALLPENYPDVIYIDPMHPMRQKSALVKKDMQALQQVIGTDNDAQDLIQIALTRAKQRVVVKWPQRLAPCFPPTSTIEGKTVRFDVYATNR
jgi:16S rRNA (guanine1516-N2)-methyltransferase